LKHIVVFASGSGTNFQALIDAVESGKINARIRGLVSNKTGIKALDRARKHGIDTCVTKPSSFETHKEYVRSLLEKLNEWNTDLIVLAGYMIKIPSEVIEEFSGRILNIHPSLLPKYGGKGFYGINVHRAVIENNEEESGCTVHLVTEEYDKGPVLAQEKVPVKSNDTPESLAERVLEKEHYLLPKVVAEMIKDLNPKNHK
jgi:formyltetrahydrofolate-dependent phosphoribosylglycinamide formyltransferase